MKTMKTRIIFRLLCAALLFVVLTSCKKLWEEERLEIIRCPHVDIQPETPDWNEPLTTLDEV